MEKYVFDFERLKVYEIGLDFVKDIYKLTENLSRNYQFSLGDQLRRASLSIVNNIAEGSGKIYKKEKAQFYRISLNSARECIPMLTILHREKFIDDVIYNTIRDRCIYICNMIGKLVSVLQ